MPRPEVPRQSQSIENERSIDHSRIIVTVCSQYIHLLERIITSGHPEMNISRQQVIQAFIHEVSRSSTTNRLLQTLIDKNERAGVRFRNGNHENKYEALSHVLDKIIDSIVKNEPINTSLKDTKYSNILVISNLMQKYFKENVGKIHELSKHEFSQFQLTSSDPEHDFQFLILSRLIDGQASESEDTKYTFDLLQNEFNVEERNDLETVSESLKCFLLQESIPSGKINLLLRYEQFRSAIELETKKSQSLS